MCLIPKTPNNGDQDGASTTFQVGVFADSQASGKHSSSQGRIWDWRNVSVGKVLSPQAGGPEFHPPAHTAHIQKLDAYNSNSGEAEMGGSLGWDLLSSLSSRSVNFRFNEIPCLKKNKVEGK